MSFITGTVTDSDGAALEDATVYIVDASTGQTEATATTNSSGDYSASVTDDNTYDLTADKRNYEPREQTGVSVGSSETVTVDFTTTVRAYKIRGEFADTDGIAVLGRNTADNGTPIGVRGLVPDADGFGIETPDDARIEGDFEATSGHTLTVSGDPTFRVLPVTENYGDANATIGGSIVGGYEGNSVNGTAGSVVLGGGASGDADVDGTTRDNTNEVTADAGVICGGLNNRAGSGGFVGNGGKNTAGGDSSVVVGGFENAASGFRAAIVGGDENTASGDQSVVGGGRGNTVSGDSSVVAGGARNTIGGQNQNAIAGGGNNIATGRFAFIGGGRSNEAGGRYPTIGGGFANVTGTSGSLELLYATIGGGEQNRIYSEYGTVGGGMYNTTGKSGTSFGAYGTVGGGLENLLRGSYATIAGGGPSDPGDADGTRNAVYDDYGTIGGGGGNRAGDDATSGTAASVYATVPGGCENEATGAYSFAAGRRAKATDEGAFVWADSTDTDVTSTGSDQFIVEAGGGVGINETSPTNPLHVTQDSNVSAGSNINAYTVRIDHNVSTAEGLAIKSGASTPSGNDDFIGFFDNGNNLLGAIEGDGSGGVTNASQGSDYAECMPRLDPGEEIDAADIVGVVGDAVTKRTDGVDHAMVVTDRAIVLGNTPEDRSDYEEVAFVGQVPVRVREPVDSGDLIVPSGEHDGTGRAIEPAAYRPGDGPLVGRAWESTDATGVSEVTVAVGIEPGDVLGPALEAQREDLRAEHEELREELAALETGNERLRDRLEAKDDRIESLESETEQLRSRLEAIAERVAAIDAGGTATPADD